MLYCFTAPPSRTVLAIPDIKPNGPAKLGHPVKMSIYSECF
jgi:hypothetical protein